MHVAGHSADEHDVSARQMVSTLDQRRRVSSGKVQVDLLTAFGRNFSRSAVHKHVSLAANLFGTVQVPALQSPA